MRARTAVGALVAGLGALPSYALAAWLASWGRPHAETIWLPSPLSDITTGLVFPALQAALGGYLAAKIGGTIRGSSPLANGVAASLVIAAASVYLVTSLVGNPGPFTRFDIAAILVTPFAFGAGAIAPALSSPPASRQVL